MHWNNSRFLAVVSLSVIASAIAVPTLAGQTSNSQHRNGLPAEDNAEFSRLCNKTNGQEKHPEMCRALHTLMMARYQLNHSAHDYNGMRVKALQETNEAIKDVTTAISSDRQ